VREEIAEPLPTSKKKDLDLMPPTMTLPPLEKETYIPPNQLKIWDMPSGGGYISDTESTSC